MLTHNEIDADIRKERIRAKRVYKTFEVIDACFILVMACLYSLIEYCKIYSGDRAEMNLSLELSVSIIDVVIGSVLGLAALYLARSLRKSTGIGQN